MLTNRRAAVAPWFGDTHASGTAAVVGSLQYSMKTTHKFKGSWYLSSMIAVIILGELIAAALANFYSLHASPIVVAFLCAGLVALGAMVLFKDAEIE